MKGPDHDDQKINLSQTLLESLTTSPDSSKGGIRTLPFIIGNGAIQRMASLGLTATMILYLTQEYGMEAAQGANVVFLWVAANNFTPIVGAFLADSYFGRFHTIAAGSVVASLGMVILWSTSMFPHTATFPSACTQVSDNCPNSASTLQILLLYVALALVSLGIGGVGSSSIAFGADQISKNQNQNPTPKNVAILQSFFNWYNAATTLVALFSVTTMVYVQESMGWKVGFALPALLMLLSAISFFLATSLYVKSEPTSSLFTGLVQVVFVACKRRRIQLSSQSNQYHHGNESKSNILMPSDNFRFLNKACATWNPEQELTSEGRAVDPWNLCTVDQVEVLKLLIRLVPLWCTGIGLSLTLDQGTYSTLLAKSMDRHITSKFEFPAGSLSTFLMLALIIWVVIYDRAIVPIASKIKGKPVRLTLYQRMGSGILCSFAAMLSIAIVESFRRKLAPQETLSVMWLVPSQVLLGVAEALTGIAQVEFFYLEMPKSMSSISSNLFILGMSLASLLASAVSTMVDVATRRGGGHMSWVSSNANNGHYDYYFFLLAALSFINFFYFLGCCKAYGPCKGDWGKDASGEVGDQSED